MKKATRLKNQLRPKKNNYSKNFSSSSRGSADPFITGGVTFIVSTHIPFRNSVFLATMLGFLFINLIPDMVSIQDSAEALLEKVRDTATLTEGLLQIK